MNINEIFKIAQKNKASDIHLVHGFSPFLRVDGELLDINNFVDKKGFDLVSSEKLELFIKDILNPSQLKRFYEQKDYDLAYQFESGRFRVNLSFEKGNIKVVFRVISKDIPSLEEIDMPCQIKDILELKRGLILLTGPSGCGKSTSLAAMINHINNTRNCNIVTLEDPIEFIFKSNKSLITQRELNVDMKSFSSGLKHALRQDPDVLLVGEMRDLETISTAITLAETGHLVLATLHTCNSAQTIDRIIDIFPPYQQGQIKLQLSFILSSVVSQILVPKKGGGRVAVREILINNTAVSNLIKNQKISQIKNVVKTSSSEGMIGFEDYSKDLYKRGLIESDDLKHFSDNRFS
jgi:twitching motility protein PilT